MLAHMSENVPERIENNVGKGEDADFQYFLLFPHCFQAAFLARVVKTCVSLRKS